MTRKEVDASGLTAVLARGSADVLRYAERRIGTEDAADALAEVMLTAWRRVDSMPRESEQARMWLFGIARNVVANATRSEHRRWRLAERLRGALASTRVHGHPADHGLEVRDASARLSGEQAELVRLVHWEGFSVADAGAILGIPASTARTRYQRARADLKEALSLQLDGVS